MIATWHVLFLYYLVKQTSTILIKPLTSGYKPLEHKNHRFLMSRTVN